MRTKIYKRAEKFVTKIIELYNLSIELNNEVYKSNVYNGNYMDACIRSYAFRFRKAITIYNMTPRSYMYKEIVMFGPSLVRKGYKFKFDYNREFYNEFSTVNNSEESEFQLLLIHDEHELFVKYVHEKIKEQIPELNEIFIASMDVRRLTPAIKAAQELLSGYNSISED